MINAFFEGDILNIWVNGQCSITQDYSFYTNKSVCVSGNIVRAMMYAPGNSRYCMVFEYDNDGNMTNMYQDMV